MASDVIFAQHECRRMVRGTADADRIVHGSISDTDLVRSLSRDHDTVVNAISSFEGGFINSVISGMEERPEHAKGTLIHISGTGNFIDNGKSGNFNPDSKVWNGARSRRTSKDHHLRCLFCNHLRLQHRARANLGVAYNIFTSNAKFAPYVGDGSAIVSTVHVENAVPFQTKIVGIAGTEKPTGSAYFRYYILHGEWVSWKELSSVLAKVLHTKGVVPSPEPKSVPAAEASEAGKERLGR
ncbi:uncharacterized protein Z519_07873 [Cladophialophora bantiana CBS 173.52]|uniref:NAD-dependent epimerase/dehydratase domain-containing protein n=1 Tax=Cladophialophora bantiana (strain ATCC 10958 / CBS 173.52 / CDC B-1940 / NIH 8579) TaxID=1442370 RepID=A0A0D2HF81_CLAB1|nr:uncharacterized protein Z519_07873 [Cladophialophora bantiana CBS 173.52]KIW91903.1 hypothetical protein Z519_07873 [Cladophialophora bantiana CBS 173.52]